MKSSGEISFGSREPRIAAQGFSLIELAVTLAIGSLVLAVLGVLASYGLQSFLVMGNCAALDDKSRLAADQMTRELRRATQVLRYESEPENKRLVITNALEGYFVAYSWNAESRTLSCEKTDEPASVCLSDCDSWEATFFQNIPLPSIFNPYPAATNQYGALDLSQASVISMSWKCSRPVAVSKAKTESAQSIRVGLRNASHP